MSAKFTQGQWEAIHVDGHGDWGVYVEQQETAVDLTICHVCNESNWHPGEGYAEANARLIAAAPELLAVLERVQSMFSYQFEGGLTGCMADLSIDVRAAICKATGEQQ